MRIWESEISTADDIESPFDVEEGKNMVFLIIADFVINYNIVWCLVRFNIGK